jgi:hypothetical protein
MLFTSIYHIYHIYISCEFTAVCLLSHPWMKNTWICGAVSDRCSSSSQRGCPGGMDQGPFQQRREPPNRNLVDLSIVHDGKNVVKIVLNGW